MGARVRVTRKRDALAHEEGGKTMEKIRVEVSGERYDWVDSVYSPSGVVCVLVGDDGRVISIHSSVVKVVRRKRKDSEDNGNV